MNSVPVIHDEPGSSTILAARDSSTSPAHTIHSHSPSVSPPAPPQLAYPRIRRRSLSSSYSSTSRSTLSSRSLSPEPWAPPSPRQSPPPASQINVDTTPLHVYHPLPFGLDAIRLVRIRPSDPDVPGLPVCSIEYHFLDSHLPYCALSYSWNLPEDIEDLVGGDDLKYSEFRDKYNGNTLLSIILDGQLFGVRMNLFFFLVQISKQLLDPGFVGYDLFWIDAICIDQENIEERNEQVGLMGNIYQEAGRVLVWLGVDAREDMTLVKEMVYNLIGMGRKLSKESSELGMTNEDAWQRHFDQKQCLTDAGLPDFGDEKWWAFCMFFRRSWFSRLWILQEVARARQIVMLCGEVEFEIKDLERCTWILLWGIDLQLGSKWMGDTSGKFQPPARTVHRICQVLRWCQIDEHPLDSEGSEWIRLVLNGTLDMSSGGAVWNTLLLLCDGADFTIPIDKVFALMGIVRHIAPEARMPMSINYAISELEARYELTSYIIQETQWLQPLSGVQHPRGPITSPSWVPGFKQYFGNQITLHGEFDASLSLRERERTPDLPMFELLDYPTLLVYGTRLDEITHVSEPYDELHLGAANALSEILVACDSTYHHTGERLSRALWKTLVGWTDGNEPSERADRIERSFYFNWLYVLASTTAVVAMNEWDFRDKEDLRKDLHKLLQSGLVSYRALIDKTQDVGFPSLNEIVEEILKWEIAEESRKENKWVDETAPIYNLTHRGDEYVFMTAKLTAGRRFFKTAKGFIGIGPEVMEEGDEVWLLPRVTVPMILKPIRFEQDDLQSAPSFSKTPTHIVMGESYVHGVMHGEILKKWQADAAENGRPWTWEEVVLL